MAISGLLNIRDIKPAFFFCLDLPFQKEKKIPQIPSL